MRLHKAFQLLAVLAVAVLTACGSSSTATSSPAPTASSSLSSSPTAVATTLDPCVLVTSSEASTIAGVTYGVGREETYSGSKGCTYGYQTLNVFMDLVAQAVDAHTARAEWAPSSPWVP